MLDKFPKTTPAIVKARLLNAASTENRTPDAQANLYPTPVTRIGAGEVRIAPALNDPGVLLNKALGAGNVGFGLPHLTKKTTFSAGLSIRNTGSTAKTYLLSPTFRDAGRPERRRHREDAVVGHRAGRRASPRSTSR